ncbi:protein phosphatase 2C domain-containing protein [Kordia sp.]|uniref:protein phosphatase 2C domain-containing protein n=1 Tax=Kordia sp. TaxID=1965332 RepID=UPI0025BFB7DF|nr:protein phosphatase 2C domain-containing protein [Kordia sp.]MCH2194210.1 protein phosphatase 2C domain-containing protein [Kordia sp.]
MKIYTSIQKGDFHVNYCEDSLVSTKIGENKVLIAVMDGCSMGTESHFASTLFAKILKKISQELFYTEFIQPQDETLEKQLYSILKKLFLELKSIKNQLNLETLELLSTLILGVYDASTKSVEIICIGDGVVVHNKTITEYEQGDKPDYFAYHLQEDFHVWYDNFKQKLSLKNVEDLSIMTDGIYTYKQLGNSTNYEEAEILIDYLSIDKNTTNHTDMLQGKMMLLEKERSLKPMDDLAIIRITNHE